MVLKLSVVEASTIIRAGRSALAQTTPPSAVTSPDCRPWVICGRSAARLRYGVAMLPSAAAPEAAVVARKCRREIRIVMQASQMAMSRWRGLTSDQESV